MLVHVLGALVRDGNLLVVHPTAAAPPLGASAAGAGVGVVAAVAAAELVVVAVVVGAVVGA